MTPRERDALVAEKVMGATWEAYPGGMRYFDLPESMRAELATALDPVMAPHLARQFLDKKIEYAQYFPGYTSEIAEAWVVARKMQLAGYEVQVGLYWDGHEGCVMKKHGEEFEAYGLSSLAARHICFAALKAKGVEIQ